MIWERARISMQYIVELKETSLIMLVLETYL